MKLHDILRNKGHDIHSIAPHQTLGQAVDQLVGNKCGALLVKDGARLVGIISERDVLIACAELQQPLEATVSDRMSRDLITATPRDDVEDVMGLLTHHRIRHLPVLENGDLVGVISLGDLVKAHHDELTNENQLLKQYIQS